MFRNLYSIIFRDFSSLLIQKKFWVFLAMWCGICSTIFFLYLDDFLTIQPTLIAKKFHYGISDIVIISYLKTTGYTSIALISSLCSKLYYQEQFSPFSQLYKTLNNPPLILFSAKILYVLLLSLLAVLIIYLPVLGSSLYYSYDNYRVMILIIGIFMLLSCCGLMAMVFSQFFPHSVLVVLITISFFILMEVATKLIVNSPSEMLIASYFSPISHVNRIAEGVVRTSDIIFLVSIFTLFFIISIQKSKNIYFSNN